MRRVLLILVCAIGAVAFLTGADGCSSSGGGGYSAGPLDDLETATCQDWLDADEDDQLLTSGAILEALNAYDQSDEFASSFADDLSTACEPVHDLKLAEAAAGIATLDPEDFPR